MISAPSWQTALLPTPPASSHGSIASTASSLFEGTFLSRFSFEIQVRFIFV
jgi:hypothetical protein